MTSRKILNPSDFFVGAHLRNEVVDHFNQFVSTDLWTSILTNTGTAAVIDGQGGILQIEASDGTAGDNDESYVKTSHELFKFDFTKPFAAECLIQYTEINTDDANIAFGFANAVAADTILDDGAGPKVNDSSAMIYKVDGSNVWKAESSNGADATTQTLSTSDATAGGAAYQRLGIYVLPGKMSSEVDIVFMVDRMSLKTGSTLHPSQQVIKHINLTTASATEMNLFLAVKNGGANLETLNCKMMRFAQLY